MFFFTGYTFTGVLIALAVLAGLIVLNETSRRYKWLSIVLYIIIPAVFTVFVWPRIAGKGSNNGGTWFAWVKTYSALAGCWIFMAIRYTKNLRFNKVMLCLPPAILSINIIEAVIADIETFGKHGVFEAGLLYNGGAWNIINAIAGILLILTLSGWVGITVSKNKSQDMVWPDQLWFWIVAYDLWNISYCYNCISNRSFYAGFILLVSCTFCEFVFRKGVWLQHRAQTLALFTMFSLTFDYASQKTLFPIESTQMAAPKMVLAILSIAANLAVFIYEIKVIRDTKRNPLKEELYKDLECYKDVL